MEPASWDVIRETFFALAQAGASSVPAAELRYALLARDLEEEQVSALFVAAAVAEDGQVELAQLQQWLSASMPAPPPAASTSPPRVVAVCGGSCSGKSTIASKLAAELNPGHAGCKAICADDFFVFDQYLTDSCPTKRVGDRVWKDWESTASIDWKGLVGAVQQAARAEGCPPYLVVEGFLLLATPESRALFDASIMVSLSKEECWRRRSSRAESMVHLPRGLSNSDEERNYEVIETYLLSTASPADVGAEAAQRYPDEGDYSWLRMYFEEIIWPAGLEQDAALAEASAGGMPVLRLDGDSPIGKEQWQQARFPEALAFLRQAQ